jgi:hypothetical protein
MSAKHKDLVERLNQLVAEAHGQAPADTKGQIEKGYEEVIDKLAHLLTIRTPPAGTPAVETAPASLRAGDPPPLGTCTVSNPPRSFPAYQADCQALGGVWTPRPRGHGQHP